MLSRTAQYAIRAVLLLAVEPDGNHGASEIARRISAPPNYTGKMLKILAVAGLLESSRGAGGGFRLSRPAAEIRLIDVVEPIDKVSRWTKCFLGLGGCEADHPCPIHPIWMPIREQYLNLLESKTIADLPADPMLHEQYRAVFTEATVPVGAPAQFRTAGSSG